MSDFTRIEDLESERDGLRTEVETLEHDNKALQLNVDDALKDLDTLNNSYRQMVETANTVITHVEAQQKLNQSIINGLRNEE